MKLTLCVAVLLVAVAAGAPGAAALEVPGGVLRGPELRSLLGLEKGLAAEETTAENAGMHLTNFVGGIVSSVMEGASRLLGLTADHFDPLEVFAWIPAYIGGAVPGGAKVSFASQCFGSNEFTTTQAADGSYAYQIVSSKHNSSCSNGEDFYLLGTIDGIKLVQIKAEGTTEGTWTGNFTKSEHSWISRNGIRIFRFPSAANETLQQLLSTVLLFEPFLTRAVSPVAALRNVEFLKLRAFYDMALRPVQEVVLPAEMISDGDFLGVIRLDGIDPMLAWAMGSHTGHTTVALRFDGELYICESTSTTAYWNVNFVQRTPYKEWIERAKAADFQVVHLPLSDAARARFNSTAAREWFLTQAEGQPYGWYNLLTGWVDTTEDNYPGALNSYSHEILAGFVYSAFPGLSALIWGAPLNKRIGTTNLTLPDLLDTAYSTKKLTFPELFNIVEQDSWRYGYKHNRSMVCDVLVCSLYKAAGLWDDGISSEVQCTEFTNWDVYSLNIFNSTAERPEACQVADPDLPYCQMLGKYRLTLPGYNTRPFFKHMAEKCPRGSPPFWDKPAGC